jgi:hypothetical protein
MEDWVLEVTGRFGQVLSRRGASREDLPNLGAGKLVGSGLPNKMLSIADGGRLEEMGNVKSTTSAGSIERSLRRYHRMLIADLYVCVASSIG